MTDVQSVSGIDRRTVVRAGVATAWAVPLVQAVAASPAFAVSGPGNLSGTTGTVTRSGQDYTVSATVQNNGGSATVGLTAVFSATRSSGTGALNITPNPPAPAGWTGGPVTWTASEQIPPGGTKTFTMTFRVDAPPGHVKTVTFTFGTTGGGAGSVSGTF